MRWWSATGLRARICWRMVGRGIRPSCFVPFGGRANDLRRLTDRARGSQAPRRAGGGFGSGVHAPYQGNPLAILIDPPPPFLVCRVPGAVPALDPAVFRE